MNFSGVFPEKKKKKPFPDTEEKPQPTFSWTEADLKYKDNYNETF